MPDESQGLGNVPDCLVHGLVMPSKGPALGWRRGRCRVGGGEVAATVGGGGLGIGVAGGPADGNPGG